MNTAIKPITCGVLASTILLGVYFAILTLVSGWTFAQEQFGTYWYFIVSLAVGFGIQIGLYVYLRQLVKEGSAAMLEVTGTTSTAATISCCTHYLVNLLPILGVAGVVTFVTQYQVQLFWVGILFNLGGIAYMINRVISFKKMHA